MLWQRLVFGSLMILAIAGLVVFDGWLASDVAANSLVLDTVRPWTVALPVTGLVVVLVTLATFEFARLARAGGYAPVAGWAAFVGAGLALLPWLELQQRLTGMASFGGFRGGAAHLTLFWLAGGFIGAALAVLARKTTEKAAGAMAMTLFIPLYLGLLGSFAVRIRCLDPGSGGAALVVYFILTVKAGDIGAFFIGRSFGKRKLAPWLSPGKTVEGFLGALLGSCLVGAGGILLWRSAGAGLGPAPFTLPQALVFGVFMATIGHLGDLVESAIKRDVGSKDSGALVPAFGGLLDLVDSPLLAAPLAWWMLTLWMPMV